MIWLRCFLIDYRRYDSCFLKWYSDSTQSKPSTLMDANRQTEFLRGESTTDECESLFKDYKQCLTVGISAIAISPSD